METTSYLSPLRGRFLPFLLASLLAITSGTFTPQAGASPQEADPAESATTDSPPSDPAPIEGVGEANDTVGDSPADASAAALETMTGSDDDAPGESRPATEPGDENSLAPWQPLLAMGLGVFVVLFLMIRLKTHAFVALILGALTISCLVPLDVVGFVKNPGNVVLETNPDKVVPSNIVTRVGSSLGGAVAGIGILIAMAAIIGKCMLASGAADRIVKSSLAVFGEKRASLAMMISGFVLSIPVFFDTVFYLLVPLARSLYRKTGKNYLLYLCAIAAGGAITHTLVPPTPGPLLVADVLEANLGAVMVIGLIVGLPSAFVGLVASSWLNKRMPIEMRPMGGHVKEEEDDFEHLPSLPMALAPVLLPVVLITTATLFDLFSQGRPALSVVNSWVQLFGNANLAMIFAALFAIYLCWKVQGHSLAKIADNVEESLLSGGIIILITAAGGAFGALLAMTRVQDVVKEFFDFESGASGLVVLCVAYALAALIKVAQGSSTVSMIITVSLVGAIAKPLAESGELGFNIAYLVPVIGAGSLMGSWMNDSGFWVFAKMGVLTEGETLRSWTVLLSILSLTGFLISTVMALFVLPMVQ